MTTETLTFAQRLKEENRTTHDSVDNLVMSVEPFINNENYAKFLKLQSVFHKIVDPIYKDEALNQAIPELEYMARHEAVLQDLADLNDTPYEFAGELPQPQGNKAIGWLYCAEGSNLGAAFLFKDAQKLSFDAEHGARHLAPHPSGRGKHWRAFVEHLNNLGLDKAAQDEAIAGAKEAFAFYKVILRQIFGLPEGAEAEVKTPVHH
ncbi:biliverdin-producing heme oxygenase [Neisseria sp. N95_16]|uniref:Biliverdin-producing heme oxygenase n=1 Tax=Neisseria brasiliensis TaxID=2666100 RepID=A0A5Q3S177_9NEIS|nr:biliverdin-producing heme oxygenase [Neisseria brasiliensis]PJO10711.1 biliverdin-producing heme oxygenase [Neisseria sp. N95_16]PJO77099.1 biliverdin-producing heme oxygenase [Neisseria sp. N177_16]QGL24744.1 biliverdin-producing heme oxygenase [Neisseria brasiliensis]